MEMVGERLNDIRKDAGESREQLAALLNVSVHTIQSWELERSAPSHDMLVAICRHYHVSADFLLGLSDEDPLLCRGRLTNENAAALRKFEAFLLNEQQKKKEK